MTDPSVEEKVKEIVSRIIRKPDLNFSHETTFKDFEADSLDIVQILVAIEDHYDIEIDDDELQEVQNMGDFLAYVENKIAEKG
ncbi:MAG: phosphopantetheine-binding protein [Dehalococcoidia bacterium]